jgi:hypothetical protein
MLKKSGLHTPFSAAVHNKHEDVAVLLLQHLVLQIGFDINHSQLATNQPQLCCALWTCCAKEALGTDAVRLRLQS